MSKRTYQADYEQNALAPITSEDIQAFASLFDENHYDWGGTFTFTNGNVIPEEHAKYFVRLFLNELDKIYFGNKAARKNIRVDRQVFLHRTYEGGRYIHFHIWFRNLGNPSTFAMTLEKLWKQSIYTAGGVTVKPLMGGSGLYGWREDISELGMNSWLQDYSHTDHGSREYDLARQGLSQETLDRLGKLHCRPEGILGRIHQMRSITKTHDRQRAWANRTVQRQDLLH